jgi:thiamine biosynthesis lipoprotein
MGARYSVKVAGRLSGDQARAARAAIEAELARVDRLMSTWRADSELSRLNAQPAGAPFPLSPETLLVLSEARRVGTLSHGAFDVTVGPLVRAWGFGPTPRVPEPPAEADVERLRRAVGQNLLSLETGPGRATKAVAETECDLSAIAPGYAADRVAAALRRLGHADVLVDVAGEILASGRRPGGEAWRVAIEAPDTTEASVFVRLADQAIATSGDYRSFYVDAGGVRRSHVIDPRSGRPVAHALAAVSVVRPTAMEADALATALLVLGPEEGLALAEREGLAAHFTVRRPGGGFARRATPGFAVLVGS